MFQNDPTSPTTPLRNNSGLCVTCCSIHSGALGKKLRRHADCKHHLFIILDFNWDLATWPCFTCYMVYSSLFLSYSTLIQPCSSGFSQSINFYSGNKNEIIRSQRSQILIFFFFYIDNHSFLIYYCICLLLISLISKVFKICSWELRPSLFSSISCVHSVFECIGFFYPRAKFLLTSVTSFF